MRRPHQPRGFTLVELLVVIGIIALLISILLPALNSARRAANQTKCAAQMKQLANAYLLYSIDYRGYYPPARLTFNTGVTYSLNDQTYPYTGYGNNKVYPYWYDFVGKYVTKASLGYNATSGADASVGRRTVIWACPAWDGYNTSTVQPEGTFNNQPGIGPNDNPNYSADEPKLGVDYPSLGLQTITMRINGTFFTTDSNDATGATYVNGGFAKATQFGRQSGRRMLFADSRFWITESKAPPTDLTFPPQPVPGNGTFWTASVGGQTMVDVYRHGKVPTVQANSTYAQKGGKVAFNILYCDGHVAGSNDQKDAYESIRLRYPG